MPVMKTISSTFSVSTVKDGQDGQPGQDGKDAHEVQPNLLLRTVFDRGLDFVKEEWTSDKWGAVSIDSQYTVEGRMSLRFTYNGSTTEMRQDVRSRVKVSTWYTLSFCYFATQSWRTFVTGTAACVDVSAGCYVDGIFQSVPSDGKVEWTADMSGRRHTFTFKTLGTLPVDCIVYFRAMTDAVYLCMPKLEVGDTATAYMAHEDDLVGEQGEQGKTGRMYYYGGEYDATSADTFLVSDAQCPFFYLQSTDNYYVYDKAPNGTYTMAQLGSPGNDNPYCTLMYNDFKYLITEAVFGSFAKFGSAVISGDWMISTNGTVNGAASQDYTKFDPAYPNTDHVTGGQHNFIPVYAVDLLTGAAHFSSGKVLFNANGNVEITGKIHADLMYAKTKYILPGTTYTVDPINDPYYCFNVSAVIGYYTKINLPSASTFDGLELRFYFPMITRNNVSPVIHSNDGIMIDASGLLMSVTDIELSPNQFVTIKAMSNNWYIVSGYVSEHQA